MEQAAPPRLEPQAGHAVLRFRTAWSTCAPALNTLPDPTHPTLAEAACLRAARLEHDRARRARLHAGWIALPPGARLRGARAQALAALDDKAAGEARALLSTLWDEVRARACLARC